MYEVIAEKSKVDYLITQLLSLRSTSAHHLGIQSSYRKGESNLLNV